MSTYLQQKFRDITISPDKYNTGCDDSLITNTVLYSALPTTVGGVYYKVISGNERIGLDLLYSNTGLGNSILIENTSFPSGLAKLNNPSTVKTVTLRNCNIDALFDIDFSTNINWILEDCTIGCIYGVSAIAKNCLFGNRMGDGLNPYKNITTENCYVRDLLKYTASETGSIIHADGFQVPDGSSAKNENIHHTNLRIEAPQFPITNQASGCYVSSCFAITPNSTHGADDISVRNSIINGGGYSIYLTQSNKTNIVLENIQVGCAKRYGTWYNSNDYTGVTISEVNDTTKLYVGSCWKDGNDTHISVTNDTNFERNLLIYTNNGIQTYIVPKCPTASELIASVSDYSFSLFPFDIDLNIGEVEWFVAYDTIPIETNQIRFVNYTEAEIESPSTVFLNKINIFSERRRNLIAYLQNLEPFYTEVAYLQSDGTQIIDTGIIANHDLILEFDVETIGTSFNLMIGGQGTSASTTTGRFSMTKSASTYNASSNTISPSLVSGTKYHIKKDGNITYVDGVLATTIAVATFLSVNPIGLFGGYTGTTYKGATSLMAQKLWTPKITRKSDGVVLRNYKSVRDSSNVLCLYDTVSKTFAYKESGNPFTTG